MNSYIKKVPPKSSGTYAHPEKDPVAPLENLTEIASV